MAKKSPKSLPSKTKVLDERVLLKRPRRGGTLKEEVWQDENGEVVKYSLAYISRLICSADHGRVLGYDNSHDYHHRHFMGTVEPVDFDHYEAISARFHAEVIELWRKEDEERA